jgi:Ribbon-helix-helix protein, copG family
VRRTQLYLEDELWAALHARARREGATISELVRVAVRERYLGNLEERRASMLGIVGLWKDRTDLEDTETMVRKLRGGSRLKRARAGLSAR